MYLAFVESNKLQSGGFWAMTCSPEQSYDQHTDTHTHTHNRREIVKDRRFVQCICRMHALQTHTLHLLMCHSFCRSYGSDIPTRRPRPAPSTSSFMEWSRHRGLSKHRSLLLACLGFGSLSLSLSLFLSLGLGTRGFPPCPRAVGAPNLWVGVLGKRALATTRLISPVPRPIAALNVGNGNPKGNRTSMR